MTPNPEPVFFSWLDQAARDVPSCHSFREFPRTITANLNQRLYRNLMVQMALDLRAGEFNGRADLPELGAKTIALLSKLPEVVGTYSFLRNVAYFLIDELRDAFLDEKITLSFTREVVSVLQKADNEDTDCAAKNLGTRLTVDALERSLIQKNDAETQRLAELFFNNIQKPDFVEEWRNVFPLTYVFFLLCTVPHPVDLDVVVKHIEALKPRLPSHTAMPDDSEAYRAVARLRSLRVLNPAMAASSAKQARAELDTMTFTDEQDPDYAERALHSQTVMLFDSWLVSKKNNSEPLEVWDALETPEWQAIRHMALNRNPVIPEALHIAIQSSDDSIQKGWSPFFKKMDGLTKDLGWFLEQHQLNIVALIRIMDDNAFPFMGRYLAHTANQLERLLETLTLYVLPSPAKLRRFYMSRRTELAAAEGQKQWGEILLLHSTFKRLGKPWALPKQGALCDIVSELQWCGLESYKRDIGLTGFEPDLGLFPAQRVAPFVKGRSHWKISQLERNRTRFDGMMKSAFEGYPAFRRFISDTTQPGEAGKVANHNQTVKTEMKRLGIDATAFLDYMPTHSFSVTAKANAKQTAANFAAAVIRGAAELQGVEALGRPFSRCGRDVVGLFALDGEKLAKRLNTRPVDLSSIETVAGTLKHAKIIDDPHHKWHLSAIQDNLNLYREWSEKAARKEENEAVKARSFTVRQWIRYPLTDIFLGSDVGCCLAPDGHMFPAMVERLLDVGMTVMVVRDDANNKAAALNWLYLAQNETDGKAYVIANFYEMNHLYAGCSVTRDRIVHELTQFTAQFARQVGAAGYLIHPLSYGLIPDFKGFPLMPVELKKVGGFYPGPKSIFLPSLEAEALYRVSG